MSLKLVLLGFLLRDKSRGYSLHAKLFVAARSLLPQIYHALNEMTAAGRVTSRRTTGGKLPERNIFSVAEAGYAEFEHWIK
jgi:DNA-binding PadR family transcriptional regulator